MLRILGGAALAGVLVATQLTATAQQTAQATRDAPTPAALMANPGAAAKGILVETKNTALGRKLVEISKGAPAESYRIRGYETVQYGSLPLAELQRTKEAARSGIIIIVVGPSYYIILIYGARAAAYQQRTLEALAAADKGSYKLDIAK
jgi:hypothetical protein